MAAHAPSLYIEIRIQSPMDQLWTLTKTPHQHEKWDLRFSRIVYLPRPDPALPQRFLYSTRIGLGLQINGEGESVGSSDGPGQARASALKFWSHDPKSLIREGSGYWKYIQSGDAVQFLTRYDYEVRFGLAGRLLDRLLFRPLIGWATAWSFDRLRIWIEKGIDPSISMRRWLIQLSARLGVGLVFVYQGLVPKVIARHPGELAMLRPLGLSDFATSELCFELGCAEIALGVLVLFFWSLRWPLWLIVSAMPLAAVAVAFNFPAHLTAPFNPIALNLSVLALAAIALLGSNDLPSASRCLRRPKGDDR